MVERPLVLGILTGGASSRMRGVPKGLLASPTGKGTLVESLRDEFLAAAPGSGVVLLGENAAYDALSIPAMPDDPPFIGPIGGLRALLVHCLSKRALAVVTSCDLPFVDQSAFADLLACEPEAAALAAKRAGNFEPFPSRFDPERTFSVLEARLGRGEHSLVGLLRDCGAAEWQLTDEDFAKLRDWDTEADVVQGRTCSG